MKAWPVLLMAAGLAALAGSVVAAPIELEFPLSREKATLDVGAFLDTEKRVAFVSVKNDLNERCEISKVVSSCDCTTPEFEKQTLGPGESAKIPLTVFKPSIREELKLDTRVAIETSRGIRLLTVSGSVRPSLKIDRYAVETRRTESGEVGAFPPVVVESLIPAAISEVSVECDGRRIESKTEMLNPGQTAFKLMLAVARDSFQEQRSFDDVVVLRFKHAGLPVKLTIDAKLSGEPRVTFEPARINVGILPRTDAIKGSVQISSRILGKDLKVSGVQSSHKDLKLALSQTQPGTYTLSYEFTPQINDGWESALRIPIDCTTNDPAAPNARIMLVGAVVKTLACCGNQENQQKTEKQ